MFARNRTHPSTVAMLLVVSVVALSTALALASDLDLMASRVTQSLLPGSAAAAAAALKAAEGLASRLQPNGTWPDIDYAERRRAGWPLVGLAPTILLFSCHVPELSRRSTTESLLVTQDSICYYRRCLGRAP
eukprot:SAG11_NODE_13157_length_667_cov_1.709507_2_plen_131_part_01